MLPSNVLKLRLDRIEQQGHHLSVKDQLKLVTLTQPDLTANIYTQIFNLTLPKIWNFRHSTKEDIHCALRLIQLITETFIPVISSMHKKCMARAVFSISFAIFRRKI
jgi:hypothetical protein